MLEFDFTRPPPTVPVSAGFDASCRCRLSPDARAAVEAGRLRLQIARFGSTPTVGQAWLEIGSTAGTLSIFIGADGARVDLAPGTSGVFDLRLWRRSAVTVGAGSTSNGVRVVCDLSEVTVGEDCMFSDGILVQSADQHGIVDLPSGRILNNRPRRTQIGHHVWLGRQCTVMADVAIGDGAIVATGAIVTGDVPPRCVAAGVPARVVREDTTWSRLPDALDDWSSACVQRHQAGAPRA